MNKIVQQAKVEGLLGAALFRTGDKPKAIETLRHSVATVGNPAEEREDLRPPSGIPLKALSWTRRNRSICCQQN